MDKGYGLTFNGRHSGRSFNLYVRTLSNILLPARNDIRVTIPGRPGNLVFESEPNNKTLSFLLTLVEPFEDRRASARQIAAWLSARGSLVMDYEPDMRYEVVSAASNVIAAIEAGYDTFTVDFECEPYQYGQKRDYSGTALSVVNNGTAPADTIITIKGSGNISAQSDGQSFSLSGIAGTVVVDSRRMMVYTPEKQDLTRIHSGGFIKVKPGASEITLSGNITEANVEFWEMWL